MDGRFWKEVREEGVMRRRGLGVLCIYRC
jgi:hypothetical protein